MEKPHPKVIEVTVISAEGLLVNRRQPAKKTVSVTVKTEPLNSRSTGLDSNGGSCLAWNEKLAMELPGNARFIAVEAQLGSRVISAASIPVSDFAGGYLPENYLSFLSYRLRGSNGEKNGIINLSVKVMGTGNSGPAAASSSRPCGTVTGIPVSYRY